MKQRNRIFAGLLIAIAIGVGFVLYRILADLDPRYRESAEESMIDTAYAVAALVALDVEDGIIHPERLRRGLTGLYTRRFEAEIFGVRKSQVELRILIANRAGTVVYDSVDRDEGADFSEWRDVALTLAGRYGARTTLENPADRRSEMMYVAAPVIWNSRIVGVVSIGKPTRSLEPFLANARAKVFAVGLTAAAAVLLLAVIGAIWLMRPFALVQDSVRLLREHGRAGLPRLGRRLRGVIGTAFGEMRDVLAGRSYTEQYVQSLTHEIKSPLSAIRGAAELLQEPMPEAQRERFLANIREQTERSQEVVDALLELSGLEKQRRLEGAATLAVDALVAGVLGAAQPLAGRRNIDLALTGERGVRTAGDPFLLHRALMNLVQNAIDFAPSGSRITLEVRPGRRTLEIEIRDHGPGVPEFARKRVFERFYSLPRPDTGKKSTGLGLSFVAEIAALHRGSIRIDNHTDGGAVATLELPRVP
ncbi:MAG: two-component system sensor histidine kinase CreC [Betaproteobacteria bacterium]